MKNILKTALVAGLIALSCTCTSLAATTAESLGAEMGQKGGFYTLYLEMPLSDFYENWGGIAGWEHRSTKKSGGIWSEIYTRSYKIEGKTVKEEVSVQVDENKNCVRLFDWTLSSGSREIIEKVFVNMYDRLAQCYPGFTDNIPRRYTHINGHKPFMYLNAERSEALGLYLVHGYGVDPNYPNYYISFGYEVNYGRKGH